MFISVKAFWGVRTPKYLFFFPLLEWGGTNGLNSTHKSLKHKSQKISIYLNYGFKVYEVPDIKIFLDISCFQIIFPSQIKTRTNLKVWFLLLADELLLVILPFKGNLPAANGNIFFLPHQNNSGDCNTLAFSHTSSATENFIKRTKSSLCPKDTSVGDENERKSSYTYLPWCTGSFLKSLKSKE